MTAKTPGATARPGRGWWPWRPRDCCRSPVIVPRGRRWRGFWPNWPPGRPMRPPEQPDPVPEATRFTGAILAGGFSRRLGQDKAALQLGGKPLALWVHEALAPLVGDCWLITNQPLAHLAFGLPLMTDLRPCQGPAGGLLTALFSARTPWVLAAAVDNPFLAPALLTALAARTS